MTALADARTGPQPWQGSFEVGGWRIERFLRDGTPWIRAAASTWQASQLGSQTDLPLPPPRQRRDEEPLHAATGGGQTAKATVELPVLMTTGSHHYQAYWTRGRRGNELVQLPFIYHLELGRFLERESVFLIPPGMELPAPRWNANCIQCHAVAGEPAHDPRTDVFDTRVADLGIGCEACHGPGGEHCREQERRARWWSAAALLRDSRPETALIDPEHLTAAGASALCGQCHAYFVPLDAERWWEVGYSYLSPTHAWEGRALVTPTLAMDASEEGEAPLALAPQVPTASAFHRDGSVRVGGREYHGLLASACYQRGRDATQLGCLTCHDPHAAAPDDQLRADASTGAVCSQCHPAERFQSSAHTHHAPESVGGDCLGCHMPKTTFALLKGIRSHTIASPSAQHGAQFRLPTACNLCHLDKSLGWTAEHLTAWYAQPKPLLSVSEETIPTAVRDGLSGDAGARALVADALGSDDVRRATGSNWEPRVLVALLEDPYPAVRLIAARSLSRFPDFSDWRELTELVLPVNGQELPMGQAPPTRLAPNPLVALRQRARAASAMGEPSPEAAQAHATITDAAIADAIANRDPTPVFIFE